MYNFHLFYVFFLSTSVGFCQLNRTSAICNKKNKIYFFSIKVQRRTTPICEVLPISVCIVYKLIWIPGRLLHQ